MERGLDPLTTKLVVADETRTDKTICLAVSPALKAYGIPGRARLFEVKQRLAQIKNTTDEDVKFIIAPPRMAKYLEISSEIYGIYLNYLSPADIHMYSVDEAFMDVTSYLKLYHMTAHELAVTMIRDVLSSVGITATAGIGTNLYLAKIAMDIEAKHIPADKDGVRVAELDEHSFREQLWSHTPLTDFWGIGPGISNRLEKMGLHTMGDIARFSLCSQEALLGRCGAAFANICTELMPTEERGEIGMVKPAGWHTQRYDDLIDGKYLYNRCHLIGYQLAGENANIENLITGTRYLNVEGMLPLENQVAEYVQSTGHHVLYRVTPLYEGDNLLANGLLIEAYSTEDDGAGVCFCNYVYNVQPYIDIDYATGESSVSPNAPSLTPELTTEPTPELEPEQEQDDIEADYIVNTNTRKFHFPTCPSVDSMKDSNKLPFTGSRDELIAQGFEPCKRCEP